MMFLTATCMSHHALHAAAVQVKHEAECSWGGFHITVMLTTDVLISWQLYYMVNGKKEIKAFRVGKKSTAGEIALHCKMTRASIKAYGCSDPQSRTVLSRDNADTLHRWCTSTVHKLPWKVHSAVLQRSCQPRVRGIRTKKKTCAQKETTCGKEKQDARNPLLWWSRSSRPASLRGECFRETFWFLRGKSLQLLI